MRRQKWQGKRVKSEKEKSYSDQSSSEALQRTERSVLLRSTAEDGERQQDQTKGCMISLTAAALIL
jgi:hypothetical protein